MLVIMINHWQPLESKCYIEVCYYCLIRSDNTYFYVHRQMVLTINCQHIIKAYERYMAYYIEQLLHIYEKYTHKNDHLISIFM